MFTAAGVPYEAIVKVGVFNIVTESRTERFFTKQLGQWQWGNYCCRFVLEHTFTLTDPLEAVERLSAIAINTTAIQVNWTELSLSQARGFPVYTIHIESKANLWHNAISAQSAPIIVTGLLPATQYTISVEVSTAANPTGAGKMSSSGEWASIVFVLGCVSACLINQLALYTFCISASVETKKEEVPTEVPTDGTAAPLIAPIAVGVGVGTAATAITTVVLLFLVVLVCVGFL